MGGGTGLKKLQNELKKSKANEKNEGGSNGHMTFSRLVNDKIDQRTYVPQIGHKKQQSII